MNKKKTSYVIQIYDADIEPLIKELASEDMRSIGNEVAWLIRKEYFSRHPHRHPQAFADLNNISITDKPNQDGELP